MAICTTCFETGIRASEHDCPGPQSVIVHREGDRAVIVEAPPRAAIALELLFEERSLITMPGRGLIELAGQVVYRVTGYVDGVLTLELVEDRRPAAAALGEPSPQPPINQYPDVLRERAETDLHAIAEAEATRQLDADPHGLKAGMIVKAYRDHGATRWVFRCWGTDTCDGWLSLDHYSEQSAERARDRHVAEEHKEQR